MNAQVLMAASETNVYKASLSSFHRHCREMISGGIPTLTRKSKIALLMLITGPILLVVHALRPLILIRFGLLYSTRLGHFAANTELYLCERDVDPNSKKTLDIFFYRNPVSNQQLLKMWKRKLRLSPLAGPLYSVNCHLPGGKHHVIPLPSDVDPHGLLARTCVHLSFTPEEEFLGLELLREMGIPEGSPFICMYSRDSAYLDTIDPDRPRHDQDYRNGSINNCISMAEEQARRGYFVIRMGAVVNAALLTTNPMIIDYASRSRTDFMDIFLGAKCSFFLGSTAGLAGIPRIFRRPIAYVNLVPLGKEHLIALAPNGLIIPKKLLLRKEHRNMSFPEIVESGAGRYFHGEQYENLGIETVENTSDEINKVAVEMDERLKGTWQTNEEDQELQQRFWQIFDLNESTEGFRPRIGAEFLRSNRELLE